MKRFLLSLFLLVSCVSIIAAQVNPNYHTVRSYIRKDGTRVKAHKRTNRNSTVNDNYSTQGNVNPWTGQSGWVPRDNGRVSSPSSYYRTTPSTGYSYDDRQTAKREYGRKIDYSDGTEHFTITYDKVTSWDNQKTYFAYGGQSKGMVSGKGYVSGLLLNGTYAMRYNNGRLLVESNFRKGLLHGKRIGYDQGGNNVLREKYYEGELIEESNFDGNTVTTYTWKVGQYDNPKIEIRENGNLQMIVEPRFGKEVVSYFDEGSRYPTRKITFEDGEADGAFEWYYPGTNTLMKTGTYRNDEFHNEVIDFERNGDRKQLFNYEYGVRKGRFILYGSGKVIETGNYQNGTQTGQSIIYDGSGIKKGELNYIGEDIATYKFFESGKLTEEGRYVRNEKDGDVKFYEDGEVVQEAIYRSGQLNGEAKIYQNSGYIKANYLNGDEDGRWTLFHETKSGEAVPIAYTTYARGALNGPFWTLQGDTILTGSYTAGLKEGAFASYIPMISRLLGIPHSIQEGVPKMKFQDGEYREGKKVGTWTTYSVGNKVLRTEPFTNDLLHGTVNEYYRNWVDLEGNPMPYAAMLKETITYVHGEKTGPATSYSYLKRVSEPCQDPNSQDCFRSIWVKDRCEYGYRKGEFHGPMVIVAEDGDTIRKAIFSMGQLEGEHYYRTNNTVIWSNFLNGKEHGRFKIIDYNTNTVSSGLKQFGERVGIWERRLAVGGKDDLIATIRYNGAERIETGYDLSQGFKNYEAKYIDGHLQRIAQFDDEKSTIASYEFEQEDSTIIISTHLFGKEEKIYTKRVDEAVKLMMIPGYFIGNWKDSPVNASGTLHGVQRLRDARGKTMYERTYNSGRLDGTILEITGSEEELIRKAVYDNGALIGENFFEVQTRKLAKGKFLIKDENGLFQKVRLKDGVRQ